MKRLAYAAFLIFFMSAPVNAGPPIRPMLIHGEVLVDGSGVPSETEITLTLTSFGEIKGKTTITPGAGLSYYKIEIPADRPETAEIEGGKAGSKAAFSSIKLSSGILQLNNITPLNWQEGAFIRQDILITPAVALTPEIISAAAEKNEQNSFSLKCDFMPVNSSELLSYKIAWYLVKKNEKEELTAELLTEKTIGNIRGTDKQQTTRMEAVRTYDGLYLELVITPRNQAGKAGPSLYRKVFYAATGGEL